MPWQLKPSLCFLHHLKVLEMHLVDQELQKVVVALLDRLGTQERINKKNKKFNNHKHSLQLLLAVHQIMGQIFKW